MLKQVDLEIIGKKTRGNAQNSNVIHTSCTNERLLDQAKIWLNLFPYFPISHLTRVSNVSKTVHLLPKSSVPIPQA